MRGQTGSQGEALARLGVMAAVITVHCVILVLWVSNDYGIGKAENREGVVDLISIPAVMVSRKPSALPLVLEAPSSNVIEPPAIDIQQVDGVPGAEDHRGEATRPPRLVSEKEDTAPGIPREIAAELGAGRRAIVVLKVLVLESGRAGEVSVLSSCGFPKFDQIAAEHVRTHWWFVPAMSDGRIVRDWLTFEVVLGPA